MDKLGVLGHISNRYTLPIYFVEEESQIATMLYKTLVWVRRLFTVASEAGKLQYNLIVHRDKTDEVYRHTVVFAGKTHAIPRGKWVSAENPNVIANSLGYTAPPVDYTGSHHQGRELGPVDTQAVCLV